MTRTKRSFRAVSCDFVDRSWFFRSLRSLVVLMFISQELNEGVTKAELYAKLLLQLRSLVADERDFIANAANLSSLLYYSMPGVNWAGFYFHKNDELVLGPFQGQPACVRIAIGKGVCGTAAKQRQTIIVDNVHDFPGHIACDSASNSEIVVPVIKDDHLIGVLDLDSPLVGRFDEEDARGLNEIVEAFVESTNLEFIGLGGGVIEGLKTKEGLP
jgi:L-methionine (R)-S-oxide reductase